VKSSSIALVGFSVLGLAACLPNSAVGNLPGTAGRGGSGSGLAGSGGTGGASVAGTAGTTGSAGTSSAGLAGSVGTAGTVGGAGTTGAAGSVAGGTAGNGSGGLGGSGMAVSGSLYVAPDGDDVNPGTMAQPVRTVSKARDIVRGLTSAMTSDLTVYLRAGTYPVTSTVTFGNADSGKGGFYVKYMAYPGERPLITGGQPIKGWKLSDATNNVYSVSGVMTPFRQLYVNGVKAVRARSPNLGANDAPSFNKASSFNMGAGTFTVASSEVASWNNLTKVEMHMLIDWADNTMRLASISTSGSSATVKFQNPESGLISMRPNPGVFASQMRYYWENALEFLDQPGEWYLDETANVLHYKPRSGEDMTTATVIAPMVETLLSVKGTSTSDQASYLWFQGLTFAHSTYMRPSQFGFLDAQAGQYNLTAPSNNAQTVGRPAAGVGVTNANHIHFERNLFTQMAATGLDFVTATHDDMILGNAFTEIGGSAISIAKFVVDEMTDYHTAYNPTDKNDICNRDTIKDNYVTHVTTEVQGAIGIAAGYPANIDIEHNEVSYVNYSGISVGYGWTAAANAMTGNKIDYNNVHHICLILGDCGPIYTLSNQSPGSEMMYNYLHDFTTSQWADYGPNNGIYMDEQTAGYTVEHNVLTNLGSGIPVVHQNKNGSNTIMDNGATPTMAQSTVTTAGVEPAYADIKTLTIPAATF
jgi:hypothetical protein